jgi:hypothetical protein
MSGSACSQDLPSPPTRSESLEDVIVSGSRIARALKEAPEPIIVVGTAEPARDPPDSIGKMQQTLPLQTGATRNTQVNNGADGSVRVILRGQGDERTLTLLNSRRACAVTGASRYERAREEPYGTHRHVVDTILDHRSLRDDAGASHH